MQLESTAAQAAPEPWAISRRIGTYIELTKARLSALVVLTAMVGFLIATEGSIDFVGLLWLTLGTAFAAGGANGLNQWIEVQRDARMERTRKRPLPSQRLSTTEAFWVSALAAAAGVALLAVTVNALTAILCALNVLLYTLVYTPLKTRSAANTLIGAVCGAIPPMMGWSAATGSLSIGGWLLAAILFAWQIPHFLALAWMYRDDYARGGYQMLPQIDPNGTLTCRVLLLYTLALIPIALLMSLLGVAGLLYATGSLVLGMMMLIPAVRMLRETNRDNAKRVFYASLLYLPALLTLLVFDHLV